jgi:hypothetical protein
VTEKRLKERQKFFFFSRFPTSSKHVACISMVHELPIIFLLHPTHFFSNKDGLVMGCLFGASEQRSLFFFSLVSSV